MSLLLLLACTKPAPMPTGIPDAPFRVAVLGDRTGEPDDAIWQDIVGQVGRLRPDLVLTVGDLADDADDEEDWARAMAPLRVLEAAGIEVQHTPGNHDIHDGASAERFERLTGQAPFRSYDRGGVHWVVVDNSIANRAEALPEEQLVWLDADLEAHADDVVVVAMHKPFWADAVAAGTPDPLHERFVAHGVDAVLTGHWHRHAYQRIDGIDYVLVGNSGGAAPGVRSAALGTTPEFLWITVDGGLTMATLTEGGVRDVSLPSLADERILNDVQRRGGLRAVLDPTGARLHLEASDGLRWTQARLETAEGSVALASETELPTPGRVPLPRVRAQVELPDSGTVPIDIVPDWPREVAAVRATPVVDGLLDEWTTHPPTVSEHAWLTALGEDSPVDRTVLWIGYDDDALYLAARCDDRDPDRIKALHTERDGQTVYNDRIGVLLSTGPDHLVWSYLTASGAVWDLHADRAAGEAHFDWDATAANATRDDHGWSVEASIPWRELGLDGPPTTLGFDARRRQEWRQVEGVFTPAFSASHPSRLGTLRLR